MIVDLHQIIIDIGFGDICDFENEDYLPECFFSVKWNWEERYLGLKGVELGWPLKSVQLAVQAVNGNAKFTPCEKFEDSRSYMLSFVKEELRLQNILKEM